MPPPPPPPIIYNHTIEETLKKAYSPTRFFLSKTRKLALFSALWGKKTAPLNCKKDSSRWLFVHSIRRFFHKLRSLRGPCLSILLLTAILSLAHCSSDDNGGGGGSGTTPAKEPDPICALAAEPSGFNGGDGMSEDSPFLICTYAQLGMMSDDLSAHYALGSNIDASASCGGDCSSPSGSGWTPVGNNANQFSGTLSGNGYVISNLFVNISADHVGLFGYTDATAEVRDVGLSDVNVRGNNRCGGLVGTNSGGSISNSYVTGEITGASIVGGLAGQNTSTGTISNSYAASATTSNSFFGGGLVGYNLGTISNSYATGAVTVDSGDVGGLVGVNDGSTGVGTISNSYAAGAVTTNSGNIGGLVGVDSSGTVSNSYWDEDTTGQSASAGSGTTGLTTTEMQDGSSAALGDGFQINAGSYPKVKKCTVCTGTLEFSDELVPGQ